jgi:2-methylisocitrate lyase-like PEP mutase family enzyme
VPQVANIVFGGKTLDPGREAFAEMGFSIVLYANTVLQAALRGAYAALTSLKKEGDLSAAGDLLASFEERQRSVAKHEWDAFEARYRLPG